MAATKETEKGKKKKKNRTDRSREKLDRQIVHHAFQLRLGVRREKVKRGGAELLATAALARMDLEGDNGCGFLFNE